MMVSEEEDFLFKEKRSLIYHIRKKWRQNKFPFIIGIVIFVVILLLVIIIPLSIDKKVKHPKDDYNYFHTQFEEGVSAQRISDTMKLYSSISHIAGSQGDHQQALHTLDLFRSFGLEAEIQEIPVLLSYPIQRVVELLEPNYYNCSLKEAVVNDSTSGDPNAFPPFNGFSASGDVTGYLVYANYGREEDYTKLDDMGIDLNGTIVIVKYGKIFRGNKVKGAQKRGAVGVLIFIDPAETGYLKGQTYMAGPWSTNTTVQRGSIYTGNGDPTTPGWASTEDGARLTYEEAVSEVDTMMGDPLPHIPVQPIGITDAYNLVKNITGNAIPDQSWAGGFNLKYIGPGIAKVRLMVSENFTVTPIWNVIAKIPGEVEPDRLVIYGAHRDAWTMGAGDPISGTSVLIETAQGLGNLLSQGWRPRRSILICSWDAEEYGLIGSIEFVETYYKTLLAQAVIYINADTAVTGTDYFGAEGSPSLNTLVNELTSQISIPIEGKTISDISSNKLGNLGSGSDFTGFIQHVGIASIDLGFGSFSGDYSAVYHSNYDSYYWFAHFGDPTFEYHASCAKLYGLIGLRMADDELLPFSLIDYSTAMVEFIETLTNSTDQVDFTTLIEASENFASSVENITSEIEEADLEDLYILRSLNDRLMLTERAFIGAAEEAGREWYLHVIYSPSIYNAYESTPFPGIANQIYLENYEEAEFISKRVAVLVHNAGKFIQGTLWRSII